MKVDEIRIDSDEDGFTLVIEGRQRSFPDGEYEAVPLRFPIEDPEDLYNAVVGTIGEWLNERNAARSEYAVAVREDGSLRIESDEDAYDPTDPKHPTYHERMSGHYDNREKAS